MPYVERDGQGAIRGWASHQTEHATEHVDERAVEFRAFEQARASATPPKSHEERLIALETKVETLETRR